MAWIEFILALRETGMSVSDIRHYVELYKDGKVTMPERKAMLLEHKKKVEAELLQLHKHMDRINYKIGLYQLLEADPDRKDIVI
jgi:DNA-binding transcriptional MerR regulator